MGKVKCSHCGLEFNKEDAIPCTWENIEPGKDFTWYYCKTCNKCFTNGGMIVYCDSCKTPMKQEEYHLHQGLCKNVKILQ